MENRVIPIGVNSCDRQTNNKSLTIGPRRGQKLCGFHKAHFLIQIGITGAAAANNVDGMRTNRPEKHLNDIYAIIVC